MALREAEVVLQPLRTLLVEELLLEVRNLGKGTQLTETAWSNLFVEAASVDEGQLCALYAHYTTNKESVSTRYMWPVTQKIARKRKPQRRAHVV